MLDDEMDHIIRDAVDKHHPAYNDKAWEKMEKKLDKHLPQEKDRRRPFFFLLLFLLLGGAAFFGTTYLKNNKTPDGKGITENKNSEQVQSQDEKEEQQMAQSVTESTTPASNGVNSPANENKTTPASDNDLNKVSKNAPVQATANAINKTNNVALLQNKNSNDAENTGKNKRQPLASKGKSNIRITTVDASEDDVVKNEKQQLKNKTPEKRNTEDKKNVVVTAAEPETTDDANVAAVTPEQKKDPVVAEAKKEESQQKEEPQQVSGDKKENKANEKQVPVTETKASSSPDKKKAKKNIPGNFGITVSAGPDLSFVELNKLGKATLTYGAGLSYQFRKRITVRAGFYASKKIYSASPEQYTFQGTTYPYLYDIDAVCKVYEIPVSLSYNFAQRKNHNWFGNAGLSSFLMKTEDYDYNYKVPYGQNYNYYTYKSNIRDRNKHYFAVLTLSAGYQYNFGKRVSLQAEPYVKLPLGGVGEGKIKLKSAGVLLTATVRPFAKKN